MIARRLVVAVGGLAVLLAMAFPVAAPAARPLVTAVADDDGVYGSQAALAMQRIKAAGAGAVRLFVGWRDTAPQGMVKPVGFDGANPADPAYNWSLLDRQVTLAIANGLQPIISPEGAPDWAQGSGPASLVAGTRRPDPVEFGKFARALAIRYSGSFAGLPRVRDFQAWNEPNVNLHLSPQFESGRYVSPQQYRAMLEQFSAAVHGVHADNIVIAGGLAAFTNPTSSAPMQFMRALLCMSGSGRPLRGCTPLRFDAWSVHPYTSGDASHHALRPDDISLPDLPKMGRLLSAAVRARHAISHGAMQFWVTEFSWDTTPPDPLAVPLRLHARWVAEALYRMWSSGVSLATWFELRDNAVNGRSHNQVYESGLYFRCAAGLQCDRPKPSLTAFRFPFVAYRSGRSVLVWGRTPGGIRGRVVVEQRVGRRWRRKAALSTDRYGIFQRRVAPSGGGDMRARLTNGSATALAFSLTRPPDRRVCSFGGPCGIPL